MRYVLGIDQSTQGTKALLCDESGALVACVSLPHEQLINTKGWVSHRPDDLYMNSIGAVRVLLRQTGIDSNDIVCAGISNQRETSLIWDRVTGQALAKAVVWHCSRAESICSRASIVDNAERIRYKTGLELSSYFSAAKWVWLLENTDGAKQAAESGRLCMGTVDSWLLYKLTGRFITEISNASRTQAFNIHTLQWDEDICEWFGLPIKALPEILPSDAMFGETDFEETLSHPIPIFTVMGDSNCALFGQGCHAKGQVKATYGTGSSVMMNIGNEVLNSSHGLVTSVAWSMGGQVNYVFEGNVNHSGSVVTWMKDQAKWIEHPDETEKLAQQANPSDETILIPAFSGLGAPYWYTNTHALISGMTMSTGRAELVKAGLESIAYQISDILRAMQDDAGIEVKELRVDGGATKNQYLMQFQSNLTNILVRLAFAEQLSGIGACYAAGIAAGVWNRDTLFSTGAAREYTPAADDIWRVGRLKRWEQAAVVLGNLT